MLTRGIAAFRPSGSIKGRKNPGMDHGWERGREIKKSKERQLRWVSLICPDSRMCVKIHNIAEEVTPMNEASLYPIRVLRHRGLDLVVDGGSNYFVV